MESPALTITDDAIEGVAWGESAGPETVYGNEPPPRNRDEYADFRGFLVPRRAAVRLSGDLWNGAEYFARYRIEATIQAEPDKLATRVRSVGLEAREMRIIQSNYRGFSIDESLLRGVARLSLTDRQNVDYMIRPERIVEDDPGSGLSYKYVREAATWDDMEDLRWSDMPDGVTWGDLTGRPTLIDDEGIPWWPIRGISDEHLRDLRKVKRQRRGDDHYREVARVHQDAKARSEPTTAALRDYFERKERRTFSDKALERWITETRKRGYLDATDK